MSESEYIEREMEQRPEPEYHSDLRILRRFVQNGSFGYRESKDEVFQTLKERYPEAYAAFGRERKQEVLERYQNYAYIEGQRMKYPNNPDKDGYLAALERLRHHVIMFRLGYGDRIRAIGFTTLNNRYSEAYEAFEGELSDI